MTRAVTTLALVAALAIGLAPGVAADHEAPCNRSPIIPEDGYDTSYPVYVVIDEFMSGDYLFSIWVYAESNGEPGLQRCDDDHCYGTPGDCDTVLF